MYIPEIRIYIISPHTARLLQPCIIRLHLNNSKQLFSVRYFSHLVGISNLRKALAPIRICWRRGISSQSKQDIVSPVKNLVPRFAMKSLIRSKCETSGCDASFMSCDSNFVTYILNLVYRFSISVATSLSCKIYWEMYSWKEILHMLLIIFVHIYNIDQRWCMHILK